jgi:hypothetical protein
MRGSASVILLSLGWAACATSVSEPLPQRIEPGQSVSLKIGESAEAAGGQLRFGFERVSADSRCPKNTKCVWAGDAVVRIWLQRGAGPRESHDLHTATGGAKAAPDPGVRLLRLEPVPVAGRALEPRDYVATLTLGAVAPPAER